MSERDYCDNDETAEFLRKEDAAAPPSPSQPVSHAPFCATKLGHACSCEPQSAQPVAAPPYWQCPNDESHPLEDRALPGLRPRQWNLYCTVCPEMKAVNRAKPAVAAPTPEEVVTDEELDAWLGSDGTYLNRRDAHRLIRTIKYQRDYTASLEARNAALSATLREVEETLAAQLPCLDGEHKQSEAGCAYAELRALLSRIRSATNKELR